MGSQSLSPVPAGKVSISAPGPLAQGLEEALAQCSPRRVADGTEQGHLVAGRNPTASERDAARQALPGLVDAATPAASNVVGPWLKRIANGLVQPGSLTPDQIAGRTHAMLLVIEDLPAACFTAETMRAVFSRFTFVPSGAELLALLKPTADALNARVAAVRRLASWTPPAAPAPAPITAEERERIAQGLAARAAEMRAAQPEAGPTKVKPAYLHGETLERARRAAGVVFPGRTGADGSMERRA